MGCSASRSKTLQAEQEQNPTNLKPSSSSSSSFSNHVSFCYQKTPISTTISLPSPLIHHPPLSKGDTTHLVSLTSTTYGSLILVDPNSDPTSPPDCVINSWELMDGLDELDFDSVQNPNNSLLIDGKMGLFRTGSEHLDPEPKPLWKHFSEESMLAEMDQNVVSSYRRALNARRLGCCEDTKFKAIEEIHCENAVKVKSPKIVVSPLFYLPSCEDKVVLYFTSLRGIRKTYEDCCHVKMILRGFKVFVEERDVSMDLKYRKELENVFEGKEFSLPKVFIRGKCIGGADEIKPLLEDGKLGVLLKGFPVKDPVLVCDGCGDARFVPCTNCNGSRKVFDEEEERMKRCPICNENGLIRCPCCCS